MGNPLTGTAGAPRAPDATGDSWPAPAKINRFLAIVGRRADGYHELQTVFQFLELGDRIHITPTDAPQIRRHGDVPGVPEALDLTMRAARTLQLHTGIRRGAVIGVDKSIPIGGGLGGGSSDAATVLVALNTLWELDLPSDELLRIGVALGADVPIFLRGVACWAEGVGERLTAIDLPEGWALVVHPACGVSTRAVFSHPELTRNSPPIRMHDFSAATCRNDCEAVVRRLSPQVDQAMDWLAQFGRARLTGTGACAYLLSEHRGILDDAARSAPAGWSVFVTRVLNRSPLYTSREVAVTP